MYTCADCTILACCEADQENRPKNCPMNQEGLLKKAMQEYEKEENHDFYISSSEIESIGYGQWTRVREIIEFSKRMGYKRLGMAFCKGLRKEARVMGQILRRNGFEVLSVMCKSGGMDKTAAGVSEERKLKPGSFEAMCNPVFQAVLLNEQHTEFNIAVGLCVGHDSFFYKYSEAPVTTLISKDRVLAHNPAGALYCADGYYRDKL